MIVLFALATALSGCAAGASVFNAAPASAVAPTGPYAQPGIARSQYECVTDEGYGRWQPCSAMD